MMFKHCISIAFIWLAISLEAKTASVDNNKHHMGGDRVLEADRILSEHLDNDNQGDYDYDHEAFLGKDIAQEYDQLPPEESKARLGKIIDRIDSNGDTFVTLDEMSHWINFTQQRYISEDVDRQWDQYIVDNKTTLTWEEYRKHFTAFLEDAPSEGHEDEDTKTYQKLEDRDRRRWQAADENNDGNLDKLEFKHFLHPEESHHMRDVVINETISDLDKNGDGLISLEEYIGDMFSGDGEESTEPDWVKDEQKAFNDQRDENGDGFMDSEEMRKWILPADYDHAEAEAKHLVHEADVDGDSKLSKDEFMEKYMLFVGSHIDVSEALTKHDEF